MKEKLKVIWKNIVKPFLLWWLEREAEKLYKKYHESFQNLIHEAQEHHRLPVATQELKVKLNGVIAKIREVNPDHPRWKRPLH